MPFDPHLMKLGRILSTAAVENLRPQPLDLDRPALAPGLVRGGVTTTFFEDKALSPSAWRL
jgi:hypothetical protein